MTLDKWLMVAFAFIGCANIVATSLLVIGRWSKRVEHPVTLQKLSWDIEQIGKEIKELRAMIDGRYSTLEQRQNADHVLIRELRTWKAEFLVEWTLRLKQSLEDFSELRTDVETLKARSGMPTRRIKDD